MNEQRTYYTPKELADKWRMSDRTIRRLCQSGAILSLRFSQLGRVLYRIPVHAVEKFENENTEKSISQFSINRQGIQR